MKSASTATRSIPISHPIFSGNEKKYVNECLDTMWVSSIGRFIGQFEAEFAAFCGARHGVACSNGTTALHMALLAMGLQPDDEVIVPTLTYVAPVNAIRYCGATPVLIDSELLTMNLDPECIERSITPRTKGIVAVHMYGHPVDMDPVREIAARHGLFVVEDAAEAHGAIYRGKTAGTLGDIATFSFFGNKIISTGEGGMVLTNNDAVSARLRLLRGQGMDPGRRYWFPMVGYNYRMTNIQAAIGLAQVEQIGFHMQNRRRVAEWYGKHLRGLEQWLTLPTEMPWARHAYWMYTVVLRDTVPTDRQSVMQALDDAGIETRPVFYPMHIMPVYRQQPDAFPVAGFLGARGINLPTHGLMSEEDVEYIAKRLKEIIAVHL
jgi:perosamine synthetase